MEKNTGKVRDFCQPGKVGTLNLYFAESVRKLIAKKIRRISTQSITFSVS